ALMERLAGGAPAGERRQDDKNSKPFQAVGHKNQQSAISNLPSHEPESRIVWRPRPSRYAISIDSTPIFRMRYRPKTTCPSEPNWGEPSPSLSTAIFGRPGATSARPMNFTVIGGGGGGGGGPVGTGFVGVSTGFITGCGGGGGGAFGLKRNRLRSA